MRTAVLTVIMLALLGAVLLAIRFWPEPCPSPREPEARGAYAGLATRSAALPPPRVAPSSRIGEDTQVLSLAAAKARDDLPVIIADHVPPHGGALTVITRPKGGAATRPAMPGAESPGAADIPFALTGAMDPNEQILAKWRLLKGGVLPPSRLNLRPPAGLADMASPQQILVFRKSVTAGDGSLLSGMELVETAPSGVKSIAAADLEKRVVELFAQTDVAAVVPNIRVEGFVLPATKYIGVQWSLKNEFCAGQDIGWHEAADRIKSAKTPLIGVVDSGLNLADPRLAALAWKNPRPGASGEPTAGDVHGWNFVTNSPQLCEPAVRFSHGSVVASIIAGRQMGGDDDVIGIAPQASIITAVSLQPPANDASAAPVGDLHTILRGIAYVVEHGAKVVNLSFGKAVTAGELARINKLPIWDELEKRGVILVCAAGNSGSDNDQLPVFPASLPRTNVISVLAIDAAGRLAGEKDAAGQWRPSTNYGKKTVHLGAPGSLILAIPAKGETELLSGTSLAAPIVTAVAALVWGEHPEWTAKQVITHLLSTARQVEPLRQACVSGGMVRLLGEESR